MTVRDDLEDTALALTRKCLWGRWAISGVHGRESLQWQPYFTTFFKCFRLLNFYLQLKTSFTVFSLHFSEFSYILSSSEDILSGYISPHFSVSMWLSITNYFHRLCHDLFIVRACALGSPTSTLEIWRAMISHSHVYGFILQKYRAHSRVCLQ